LNASFLNHAEPPEKGRASPPVSLGRGDEKTADQACPIPVVLPGIQQCIDTETASITVDREHHL
jgi:hypothetical protein